jgi:hypothetical protein
LALRDPKAAPTGTFDVRSEGFGVGDPKPLGVQQGGGSLNGGSHGAMPYVERKQEWGPVPGAAKRDVLDVDAKNVRTATIDAPRARVSCAARVNAKSDGPLDVILTGCSAAGLPSSARCVDRRKFSFKLHRYRRARIVRVRAYVNGKRTVNRRGRDIRRVTIRRLPQGTFTVKIVSTQSTGSQLVSTRTYRGCKKSRPRTRGHHRRRGR